MEIESIIARIVKDFSHLVPGLAVQFLTTEAYQTRVAGRISAAGEESQEILSPAYPLHSIPQTSKVLVCTEEVAALLAREAPELGPRAKAEEILCRHWPLQYTTFLAGSSSPATIPNKRHEIEKFTGKASRLFSLFPVLGLSEADARIKLEEVV